MKLPREIIVVITCLLAVGAAALHSRVEFVWNATSSYPRGLYRLERRPHYVPGDLVWFEVPDAVDELVYERGYIPQTGKLLKHIVAGPGVRWCVDSAGRFSVAGQSYGRAFGVDAHGAPLPTLRGCWVIPSEHVLVASTHPRSFDSRYFGAVPVELIVGATEALWTYSR